MEGGGGSIVISNIPSSAVVANVMNGCERSYERMLPPLTPGRNLPSSVLRNNSNVSNIVSATNTAASAYATTKNDNVENSAMTKVQEGKSTSSIINNQEEGVAGSSGVAACSSSVETANSIETSAVDTAESQITIATELGFPAIGSPSADLMVVNTNGFNPLQYAALRGNPG